MDTQKTLINTALTGLDHLGYRLDQLAITARLNRHNAAAFLMAGQHHLEGEWDSLQARFDRRKAGLDAMRQSLEARIELIRKPLRRLRGKV